MEEKDLNDNLPFNENYFGMNCDVVNETEDGQKCSCFHITSLILKELQDLKATVRELHEGSSVIQNSLKMLEVVVCTLDGEINTKEATPTKNVPTETFDVPNNGNQHISVSVSKDGSQKRKSLEVDDNVDDDINNNVILNISDGDEENEPKKLCRDVPKLNIEDSLTLCKSKLPKAWTQSQYAVKGKKKVCDTPLPKSDYRRTNTSKILVGESSTLGFSEISKKLFQTPPSQGRTCNQLKQLAISTKEDSCSVKGKPSPTFSKVHNKMSEGRHTMQKVSGILVPKGTKLKFRPTVDMHLDLNERQAATYIFHSEQDPCEILVMSRNLFGTRAEFDTLCPGKYVSSEIIALAADRVRWFQENFNTKAVWCLPPSFYDDVFSSQSFYDVMQTYSKEWMDPYPYLQYIYVPIKNEFGHWYLMVVSMLEKVVYHLDSFLREDDIEPRTNCMRTLCEVLSQIAGSSYYGTTFHGKSLDFDTWPIKEVRGIPNCGSSVNSGIWVLHWLSMEENFVSEVVGMMNENHVRMKTATNLVFGLNNELKAFMEEKATYLWISLSHGL